MAEAAALVVILTLYIIPLNIFVFKLSQNILSLVQLSQSSAVAFVRNVPGLSYIIMKKPCVMVSLFYALLVAVYFIMLYLVLKYLIFKSIYLYSDEDIDEESFMDKYKFGQESINRIAYTLITIAALLHAIFGVVNVRIIVFYILCIMFVYKSAANSEDGNEKTEKVLEEEGTEGSGSGREAEPSAENENTVEYKWEYNKDPFLIEQPVSFTANIAVNTERYKEYQAREHTDNSPDALRRYVIDGLCPEITELAGQIKKICSLKGLTTYHQVSAVMALQQSMKYVYDIDSKGSEEYIRYPLETLVEKEGDCDCHSICSAAILYSMGYDVVLLRIIYPEGDGHLALAVEGADGIPGNFFKLNNKKYYYCEVTPGEEGSMAFKVGEMPEIPGANISIIQIKESITKM